MRFKSKPVVIDAVPWYGYNFDEVKKFCPIAILDLFHVAVLIQTLEGTMTASKGDWIIKGTHGEFYPCKPEVFAVKYESV